MSNEITPDDIAAYQVLISQWQQRLGLQDWRFIYSPKIARGAMSDMTSTVSAHTAVYRIGKDFGLEEVTPYSLDSTACHESLHTLLAELIELVKSKASADLQMAAQHRIIHTLERLLVPKP